MAKRPLSDGLDATSGPPSKKPRLDGPPSGRKVAAIPTQRPSRRSTRSRQPRRTSRLEPSSQSQGAGDSTTMATPSSTTRPGEESAPDASAMGSATTKTCQVGADLHNAIPSVESGHASGRRRQLPGQSGDGEEDRLATADFPPQHDDTQSTGPVPDAEAICPPQQRSRKRSSKGAPDGDEDRPSKRARVEPSKDHDLLNTRWFKGGHLTRRTEDWMHEGHPRGARFLEARRKNEERLRAMQDDFIRYRLSKLHNRLPSPSSDDNGGHGGHDDDSSLEPDPWFAGITPDMLGVDINDEERLMEVFGVDHALKLIASVEEGWEAQKARALAPPTMTSPWNPTSGANETEERPETKKKPGTKKKPETKKKLETKRPATKKKPETKKPATKKRPEARKKPEKTPETRKKPEKTPETRKTPEKTPEGRKKIGRTAPASQRLTRQNRSAIDSVFYELDQRGVVCVA